VWRELESEFSNLHTSFDATKSAKIRDVSAQLLMRASPADHIHHAEKRWVQLPDHKKAHPVIPNLCQPRFIRLDALSSVRPTWSDIFQRFITLLRKILGNIPCTPTNFSQFVRMSHVPVLQRRTDGQIPNIALRYVAQPKLARHVPSQPTAGPRGLRCLQ